MRKTCLKNQGFNVIGIGLEGEAISADYIEGSILFADGGTDAQIKPNG